MKTETQKEPQSANPLLDAAEDGTLLRKLQKYLRSCRPPDDANPKRDTGRLPNPSGLCVFLHCGLSCMEELRQKRPECYDYLRTVFEDELLNAKSVPSAGLATAYLKDRLGFGEATDRGEGTPLQVIFAHDIEVDGA